MRPGRDGCVRPGTLLLAYESSCDVLCGEGCQGLHDPGAALGAPGVHSREGINDPRVTGALGGCGRVSVVGEPGMLTLLGVCTSSRFIASGPRHPDHRPMSHAADGRGQGRAGCLVRNAGLPTGGDGSTIRSTHTIRGHRGDHGPPREESVLSLGHPWCRRHVAQRAADCSRASARPWGRAC